MAKSPSKHILVTGGAGFIGMNAAIRFRELGWGVTILDNLSRRGTELNLRTLQKRYGDGVTFVRGDVRTDQKTLGELVEACDVVLHLAAQVAVTTSVTNPREDFEINALGTFNLLEAIRTSRRRPSLLYASTNKVYGGLEHIGVREEEKRYVFQGELTGVSEREPLDFHSPYGCSKGSADQYVRDYARLYDMKTVVFRQSCIYGPQQFGVEDQGWVAWFLIAAMLGRPVTIYGNGKQVRDLLSVDDLLACYEAAIARMDRISGSIYNVGGGAANTLSLLEFLALIQTRFGLSLNARRGGVRPGDQPIFVSDNGKALQELEWAPRIGVHAGLDRLHAWLREHEQDIRVFYD
ncbi:GDP-mannose 4,6-dehydratase [Candidatus Peregrinibacteria bacterium]|nr:GDP-mannose 4,6-dehydratase [Candidatus Peregrinibacteria bacterium]MBI3816694.1 GDP-mannose 4,6-dehydratase [Candidatus Peregrinibacteria bacterium]